MGQLPIFADWQIHWLWIHCPLAFFFAAGPLISVAALTRNALRSVLLVLALGLMILGTVLVFVGSKTMRVAEISSFATFAWESLAAAVLLYALAFVLCRTFHLELRELSALLPIGFVVFYMIGLFWLMQADYKLGRLVN